MKSVFDIMLNTVYAFKLYCRASYTYCHYQIMCLQLWTEKLRPQLEHLSARTLCHKYAALTTGPPLPTYLPKVLFFRCKCLNLKKTDRVVSGWVE